MLHRNNGRVPLGVAGVDSKGLAAIILTAFLFLPIAVAQTKPESSITNLMQLSRALRDESYVVRDVRIDAAVFAHSTNSGALVVEDASGAQLLEMDSFTRQLHPGDLVRIESSRAFFRRSHVGICLSQAPLLNNDDVHTSRVLTCEYPFKAGRYPFRVDWFNQFYPCELDVSCVLTNSELAGAESAISSNLLHVTRAECYEGYWSKIPNFQLLPLVKSGSASNFDIGYRTRDDMAGMRFEGYFDAPKSGKYLFQLRSDDGSRIYVGDVAMPVRILGTTNPPAAPAAIIGEPMSNLDEHRLVTVEGRVSFVSRFGKGLRLEIRAEPNSIAVTVADAGDLPPQNLLNARVRASGVASGVLTEDQRVIMGRLAVASSEELAIVESAPGKGPVLPVLTTLLQVHSLTAEDAARQLPVKIRGVVTALAQQAVDRWMAIQDDTRGSFIRLSQVSNCVPNIGEFWSVSGHTEPGDFAPIIVAESVTLLGKGRMPNPAHPTWNQLINGSMDVQCAELQGLITGVQSNWLSMLLPEGRMEVRMPGWGESSLKPFDKSVVRIRGTLFALWNADTHEVLVGSITMHNASIMVDKPAPADPFDALEKTPRGLFLFDAKATPFQRVKVRGVVTYADARRVFIEQGGGIEVQPTTKIELKAGDLIEAVGYPEISGATPVLREALLRKTGSGPVPEPAHVPDAGLGDPHLASTRIRLEGTLASHHLEENTLVLQMQTQTHLFLARVPNSEWLRALRLGSRLSLTGIYLLDARTGSAASDAPHFELLLNAPRDVAVISTPSWWTLQRLLTVVGLLLVSLTVAAAWITVLKRQVAQRTLQLQHEIREREHAERQHALEAERSRIARDLHDDLGSSLTEINVLASTGQRPRVTDVSHPALFKAIADKARGLIAALDIIVWAVDPEDNSLQSLADYLSGYTREYLSSSAIACRFKIPVTLPDAKLDGQVRHELLMVVKETLNNTVRHAHATEVEFQLEVNDNTLEISIADNGKGFDPSAGGSGHGLKNRQTRLAKIGGTCRLESRAGTGTTICIRLPLPRPAANPREEANTTFV